jgi:hypothetical protein
VGLKGIKWEGADWIYLPQHGVRYFVLTQ